MKWHVPRREEIEFACELFQAQVENALSALVSLTSGDSSVKRDGTGKDWSDEMIRNLTLLRLILSGSSMLFDPQHGSTPNEEDSEGDDAEMSGSNGDAGEADLGVATDEEIKTTKKYPAGYVFSDKKDPLYILMHELRDRIGKVLHETHVFLKNSQQDDVQCFNALYAVNITPQLYFREELIKSNRPINPGSKMSV